VSSELNSAASAETKCIGAAAMKYDEAGSIY